MWTHEGVPFENTPFEVGQKESRNCLRNVAILNLIQRKSLWCLSDVSAWKRLSSDLDGGDKGGDGIPKG